MSAATRRVARRHRRRVRALDLVTRAAAQAYANGADEHDLTAAALAPVITADLEQELTP